MGGDGAIQELSTKHLVALSSKRNMADLQFDKAEKRVSVPFTTCGYITFQRMRFLNIYLGALDSHCHRFHCHYILYEWHQVLLSKQL
jgi:hypothetical protein